MQRSWTKSRDEGAPDFFTGSLGLWTIVTPSFCSILASCAAEEENIKRADQRKMETVLNDWPLRCMTPSLPYNSNPIRDRSQFSLFKNYTKQDIIERRQHNQYYDLYKEQGFIEGIGVFIGTFFGTWHLLWYLVPISVLGTWYRSFRSFV
jgi:hypothetical protein